LKQSVFFPRILKISLVFVCVAGSAPLFAAKSPPASGETIVMVRHGEKPGGGLGQLNCRGLNRALALPAVLIGRYGKPDSIYAPNPSVMVNDGESKPIYSYVRPLATIEPTAIRLGMPVNTQMGFDQIDQLQQELLQPAYAHSLIFVAWEHVKLHDFAQQLLQRFGTSSMQVPAWAHEDYETIYVFHVVRSEKNGTPQVTLDIEQEGLDSSLKNSCPNP
jgi:hypothetical protein